MVWDPRDGLICHQLRILPLGSDGTEWWHWELQLRGENTSIKSLPLVLSYFFPFFFCVFPPIHLKILHIFLGPSINIYTDKENKRLGSNRSHFLQKVFCFVFAENAKNLESVAFKLSTYSGHSKERNKHWIFKVLVFAIHFFQK